MQELLMNSVQKVSYAIYKDGVPTDADADVTVAIYSAGVQLLSDAATNDSEGRYSYVVPSKVTVGTKEYDLLGIEGTISVVWSFEVDASTFAVTELYNVVTPYSAWHKFSEETAEYTYKDFLKCERIVRFIINSHCGQTFGKETNTYLVEGNGQSSLILPKRLINLIGISYFDEFPRPGSVIGMTEDIWELTADNWVLRNQPQRNHLNIIYDYKPRFLRNKHYSIEGLWGYESVPVAVQEAAEILIADYLCAEHKYRDKYLQKLSMNDWKLEFHNKAFEATGNATADALLKDYRLTYNIGLI